MAKNVGKLVMMIVVFLFIAVFLWIIYKRTCTSENESIIDKFFEPCQSNSSVKGVSNSVGGTKKCKQKKRKSKKY